MAINPLASLHQMYQRLATKMEDDVARLKDGLEKLVSGHNALVDRVAQLEAKLASVKAPPHDVAYAGPKLKRAPAPPPARAATVTAPTVQAPEPEDAEWYEGEEE